MLLIVKAASSLMQHITDVIIEMVASTIEEILITMHESDFSGYNNVNTKHWLLD